MAGNNQDNSPANGLQGSSYLYDYGTSPNVFYIAYDEETYDRGSDVRNDAPKEWGQNRG